MAVKNDHREEIVRLFERRRRARSEEIRSKDRVAAGPYGSRSVVVRSRLIDNNNIIIIMTINSSPESLRPNEIGRRCRESPESRVRFRVLEFRKTSVSTEFACFCPVKKKKKKPFS